MAHCGLGPYAYDAAVYPEPEADAWVLRIQELLDYHPNVYFDMAGMQLEVTNGPVYQLMDGFGNPTPTVGEFLKDALAAYPTRFMLGVDAKTQYATEEEDPPGSKQYTPGIATYADSVADYEAFLAQVAWNSAGDAFRVRYGNAAGLI